MKFKSLVLSLLFILRLSRCFSFNILNYVRNNYGEDQKVIVRRYEHIKKRLEKNILDLDFIHKCKIYNKFPKFLQFKLYKKALRSSTFYRRWQAKLLQYEIQQKNKTLISLRRQFDDLNSLLSISLSPIDCFVDRCCVRRTIDKYVAQTKNVHCAKLERLGVNNDTSPCDPDKTVYNFSSVCLSPRLKILLAYGLDFSLPIYRLDFYKYFLPFESLISRVKNFHTNDCSNFPEFLNKIHAISFKYYYNFNPFKIFSSVVSKTDIRQLKELASNKEVIVCKPDKGRGVVLLDRSTYINKITEIISDASKFELLSVEMEKCTTKIEDKINNFFTKIKRFISHFQ